MEKIDIYKELEQGKFFFFCKKKNIRVDIYICKEKSINNNEGSYLKDLVKNSKNNKLCKNCVMWKKQLPKEFKNLKGREIKRRKKDVF